MQWKLKRWMMLFLCAVMASCVGIGDLSQENYRRGALYIRSLSQEKMAVLPMTGQGKGRLYLKQAEEAFLKVLPEMRPKTPLLLPATYMQEETTAAVVRHFTQENRFKSVIHETDLTGLKAVLNTRYLLQTELQQVEFVEGATHVRIEGRLWDLESGDILWEGTGESRGYIVLFFPTVPANFEKVLDVASRGLIQHLP